MQVLNNTQIHVVSGGRYAGALTGLMVGGGVGLVPVAFLVCLSGGVSRMDELLHPVLYFSGIPAGFGFVCGATIDLLLN